MASTTNHHDKKEKKKQNKDKKKNKAVATPTKKTPTKQTSTIKTPVKKTPKQDQDKKKNKNDNGRVTDSLEVISPSRTKSQVSEHEIAEARTPTSKPNKTNKKKQKAANDDGEEGEGSIYKFPMARIRRIIKSEDSSLQLAQDVVFLVNKATEKFIEQFCEEAYDCSVRDRKKTLSYNHLSTVVSEKRRFDFLSDYVPVKLKAEAALEQRKLVENARVLA